MFVIHIKETKVAAIAMVSFSGAAIAPNPIMHITNNMSSVTQGGACATTGCPHSLSVAPDGL